jgi:hypothetical protein
MSGCIRIVALLAVAALFTNAQCYGKCAIAACTPAQTSSGGCRHHNTPAPDKDQPNCVHHHSDLTGPELGMAKAGVANSVPTPAVLAVDSIAVPIRVPVVELHDNGSPPGLLAALRPISVLRI